MSDVIISAEQGIALVELRKPVETLCPFTGRWYVACDFDDVFRAPRDGVRTFDFIAERYL